MEPEHTVVLPGKGMYFYLDLMPDGSTRWRPIEDYETRKQKFVQSIIDKAVDPETCPHDGPREIKSTTVGEGLLRRMYRVEVCSQCQYTLALLQ